MPDWTYQTIFRPILFRLRPETARGLALDAMGRLSRLPLGKRVIQFMGHMSPDPRLALERNGLRFPTPVGLGSALDPNLSATPALAEFGFGFLEVGPITMQATVAGSATLNVENETVCLDRPQGALSVSSARDCLQRDGPFRLPVFARISPASADEAAEILQGLDDVVDGYFVRLHHLDAVRAEHEQCVASRYLFALVDVAELSDETLQRCTRATEDRVVEGVVLASGLEADEIRRFTPLGASNVLESVSRLRETLGPAPFVINSVGVHSPADALDSLAAGADLVQVDSGIVFSGPGLPKRINEAVLYRNLVVEDVGAKTGAAEPRVGGQSWFWAFLMGLSMLIGGVMALVIAVTRVVMPYDEMASGLSREELMAINDRLLSFMTHDRVTLAGTMLAVGILYVTLANWGIRRGLHWAYVSVVLSAMAGFISFFSFLGFGYFDPFHAFVTAILFQFLLLTIHSDLPARRQMEPPDLWNDGRWKLIQWGQLSFVVHGAVLIVAGMVISKVGMTSVFVPEDLEFMQTTAETLTAAHPRLVPLVAHDRATFGGMLIACGAATLLPALWGFRRGQAWLWWALMLAGNVAYGATMLVHWQVGYHSLKHLLPAYGGLLLLWIGGGSSYRYMAARDTELEAEWERRVSAG